MSDTDSFISEVSQEVRRERLSRFLGRYGWMIAAAILVVIAAAAGYEWRKARAEAAAQARGDALRAAFLETDPAARAERFGALAGDEGGAVIARLAQAGSLIEAGDRQGAAEILAGLAESGTVPQLYRELAALQRVAVLGAEMPQAERLATLEALTQPEAPFRPLALEQRALALLDAGDTARALTDLQAVLDAPTATEGVRARARQLLIAAGGELPAGALPAPLADG